MKIVLGSVGSGFHFVNCSVELFVGLFRPYFLFLFLKGVLGVLATNRRCRYALRVYIERQIRKLSTIVYCMSYSSEWYKVYTVRGRN